MFSRSSNINFIVIILSAHLLLTDNAIAYEKDSFIEYTTSINTSTFDSIKTIGLFARGQVSRGERVYGGLQFSHFRLKNGNDSTGFYRVLIGATTTGRFAPFLEIGTNFLDLFRSRNDSDCGNGNQCDINAFINAGIRIRLSSDFSLGLFHESLSFDDTNSNLSSNHNYTGMSLGYDF